MGSTESKGQSADTAVSKTAEQQENGHVKANGDTLPKTNGEPAAANGSAEPVTEEAASAETIEQAPPANGDTKPEEPPGKQAKKKRFSFKKNFKLPFRKTKKDAAEAPPAGDEAAAAPKPEEEEPAKPAEPAAESSPAAESPEPAAPAAEEPPAAHPEAPVTPAEQPPQSDETGPSTETPAEPPKEE